MPYEVHRRARRTVGVVVRPDGRVDVLAPQRTSEREIRTVVEEFRPWIEKKRREALERVRNRRIRRFDDGDEVPYLGETLRLRVIDDTRVPSAPVAREGERLVVRVEAGLSAADRGEAVRYAVRRWLLDEACRVFHGRHVAVSRLVGDAARHVVIKDMRTRWGSCGPDRRMNLNWRLILAPEPIIDYVLAHELSHIAEPNHSSAFWRRVAGVCEHYKDSRKWLRTHGDELDV